MPVPEAGEPRQPATAVVLCLLQRGPEERREVLLGHKLHGFGHGKFVLPGGKIEPGEGAAEAAARELAEETGLATDPSTLRGIATIGFIFPASQASDMQCTVFRVAAVTGAPQRTAELSPSWHPVDRLPLTQMWEDSPRWLVPLLQGVELDAEVVLADDNLSVASYHARARH